jgi:hypothetical protein
VLRALADAENTRRRAEEEIAKVRKFAVEALAESLLPVVDSLEAGLAAQDATLEQIREGTQATLQHLGQIALAKAAPEPATQVAAEPLDQRFAIGSPFLPALFALNDAPTDRPVRRRHHRIDAASGGAAGRLQQRDDVPVDGGVLGLAQGRRGLGNACT